MREYTVQRTHTTDLADLMNADPMQYEIIL